MLQERSRVTGGFCDALGSSLGGSSQDIPRSSLSPAPPICSHPADRSAPQAVPRDRISLTPLLAAWGWGLASGRHWPEMGEWGAWDAPFLSLLAHSRALRWPLQLHRFWAWEWPLVYCPSGDASPSLICSFHPGHPSKCFQESFFL